jgi:hypothetical protein
MKPDVALSFGSFSFFSHYGRVVSFEELWEDGALVWGFIRCDCCRKEVDKAILLNRQYFCESCLEKNVQ